MNPYDESRFDEEPAGDPHGECAAEIARLTAALSKAEETIRQQADRLAALVDSAAQHRLDIEGLSAQLAEAREECAGLKIDQGMGVQINSDLRDRIKRLRAFINDLTMVQYHACVTGDCPHDHVKDCADALTEEMQYIGQQAEDILRGAGSGKVG